MRKNAKLLFFLFSLGIGTIALLTIMVFLIEIFSQILEPSTRSKTSQARSDLRSISTAIESYYIDHQQYPAALLIDCFPTDKESLINAGGEYTRTFHPGGKNLHGITTPVAYMSSIINNPWLNAPFAYHTTGECYILYSTGNDKDFDIQNPQYILSAKTEEEAISRLSSKTYDPTNGQISSGDIWSLGYNPVSKQ